MTARPLVVCDCDEVLMHFAIPFAGYLAAEHEMDLAFESFSLAGSIRRRATGEAIGQEDLWPLLDGFFDTHMHTQYPVAGAAEALAELSRTADIMVLTNIRDMIRTRRGEELVRHGMSYEVHCNEGPKGPALARLIEGRQGPVVFVDDLPPHHSSVKRHAPHVHRLHMIADPTLAKLVPPAADAHARIDDWPTALDHIRRIIA